MSKNKIIFVIGSSRSGTTMLSRILNNHSKITSLNELHFFNDILKKKLSDKITYKYALSICNKLLNRIDNDVWTKIDNNTFHDLSNKILSKIDKDSLTSFTVFDSVISYYKNKEKSIYILEQTPKNILYFEEIIKFYPYAKFIHIIRDPRAVIASQKNRWKKIQRKADNVPIYNILRTLINYHPFTSLKLWKIAVKKGLSLRKYNDNYLELKFEDLILNESNEINKILDFLSLNHQSNLANVPQIGSSNFLHRKDKFGLNKKVIDSWKSILTKSELYICSKLTKSEQIALCYKPLKVSFNLSVIYNVITYPFHLLGVILINPNVFFRTIKKYLKI